MSASPRVKAGYKFIKRRFKMLEKIGKGTTLEDLNKVKGGIIGLCGTNCCSQCGQNNSQDLSDGYAEWERTDF
jgi:hypothetical protein